jgi:hypothetical protein
MTECVGARAVYAAHVWKSPHPTWLLVAVVMPGGSQVAGYFRQRESSSVRGDSEGGQLQDRSKVAGCRNKFVGHFLAKATKCLRAEKNKAHLTEYAAQSLDLHPLVRKLQGRSLRKPDTSKGLECVAPQKSVLDNLLPRTKIAADLPPIITKSCHRSLQSKCTILRMHFATKTLTFFRGCAQVFHANSS